jgi:hypothetical protein
MNASKKKIFLNICSLLGILGPCMFLIIITLLDYLWKEYDGFYIVFSGLGAEKAPYAIYMNLLGFGFLGTSIIFLGMGLFKSIKRHVLVSIGSFLFISSGILIMLLIFFPLDAGLAYLTISAQLHRVLTYTASFLMPIGIIFLIYPLKSDENWKFAWLYFPTELLIYLMIIIPIDIILKDVVAIGLFQRISMGVILIWMILMSIHLYYLVRREKLFLIK